MSMTSQELSEIPDWKLLADYATFLGALSIDVTTRNIAQSVTDFFNELDAVDGSPAEVLEDYIDEARSYADVKSSLLNWRQSLKQFQAQIHSCPVFSSVPPADRSALYEVVSGMLGRMSVKLGRRTENNAGDVSISRTVIKGGVPTAMFALFHEIGHGIQTDGEVPKSIKDAIYASTETSARFGELFSDAFAVIALRTLDFDTSVILAGAEKALAGHGADADHPPWATRNASIRAVSTRL